MAERPAADGSFLWEDLDQRLFSPKIDEIAEELTKRISDARKAIWLQSRNSAGYVSRLIEFYEQLADERAGREYAAYCDAWKLQGNLLNAGFIRGVRDNAILPKIVATKSSMRAELTLESLQTSAAPDTASLDEWSRRMDRLTKKWASKLEADAVACEYKDIARPRPSQAPPPITPLRTGSIRLTREPTRVPTDLPTYYPSLIRLKTMVQLGEAAKEFSERSQLQPMCRNIVSRLTPILLETVNQGSINGHAAPEHLKDLLHSVLGANCESSDERFRIENAVINSDEWHEIINALAACERSEPHKLATKTQVAPRRRQIEEFIEKMRDAGYSIRKKDIWRVAGYADRTEFMRFQREDKRTTAGSASNFNRVLSMTPQVFMEILGKKRISK